MKKILVLFLLIIAIMIVYSADNWKLRKDKDDILIYTKEVQNNEFDEFKGITIISCGIEILISLLKDIPNNTNWMAECIESRLVEKISNDIYIIYSVTKVPWPLKNRDCIWERRYINNLLNGEYYIEFKDTKHSGIPEDENNIRITESSGYFKFKIIDENHTEVTYRYKGNPGGNLSPKLANATSIKLPYETLLNMKNIVKN